MRCLSFALLYCVTFFLWGCDSLRTTFFTESDDLDLEDLSPTRGEAGVETLTNGQIASANNISTEYASSPPTLEDENTFNIENYKSAFSGLSKTGKELFENVSNFDFRSHKSAFSGLDRTGKEIFDRVSENPLSIESYTSAFTGLNKSSSPPLVQPLKKDCTTITSDFVPTCTFKHGSTNRTFEAPDINGKYLPGKGDRPSNALASKPWWVREDQKMMLYFRTLKKDGSQGAWAFTEKRDDGRVRSAAMYKGIDSEHEPPRAVSDDIEDPKGWYFKAKGTKDFKPAIFEITFDDCEDGSIIVRYYPCDENLQILD